MSNESQVPVDYEALLAEQAKMLADKINKPSGDRIQVTQNKQFKFPDGTQSDKPFEAIIVNFVSMNSYYSKPYARNEIVPPDCFALGDKPAELVPHPKAPHKQATSCAVCPHNQFNSAANGRGKACNNTRRLALLPSDFTADTPLRLLNVSPTALKAFDTYVSAIAANFNAPPVKVVTTIGFDPKVDYPSLRFGAPRPNDRLAESVARMDEAHKRLLTEPDYQLAPTPGPTADTPAPPSRSAVGGRVTR